MDSLEQNEQFDLGAFVDNMDRNGYEAADEEDGDRDD